MADTFFTRKIRRGYRATRRLFRDLRYLPALNPALIACGRTLQWLFGRPLRRITEYIPIYGIVTVDLGNGLSMRLLSNGDDALAQNLFWNGLEVMEPEVVAVFRQLVKGANCFFDVGAHVGFYSLLGAILNPALDIHTFEPYHPVFERLKRNIELNGIRNIKSNCIALGDYIGEQPFFYQLSLEGNMTDHQSCNPNAIDSESFDLGVTTIEMETGDSYCQRHDLDRVDLIKLDTELTEDRVLDGLSTTIQRDRPTILCEALPEFPAHTEEVWKRLAPLDYRVFRLTIQGPIPLSRLVVHPDNTNYLFLPQEKTL